MLPEENVVRAAGVTRVLGEGQESLKLGNPPVQKGWPPALLVLFL
jgi:hypothetical protein